MSKHGNTSSAVALATQMAIDHNMKILLLSTSLNDNIIKDSFWKEAKKKKLDFLMTNSNSNIEKNGVEGLDRILRSNRIAPNIITDYTKVILTNRLEILLGIEGTKEQYDLIKERYLQIMLLANQYYDMVIVDLDRNLGEKVTMDILQNSDIVVNVISQRAKQIERIVRMLNEGSLIKQEHSVIAIGRYMEGTKYNAKNISRNLLRSREIIDVIPYNNLFFEASQEGEVINLFLSFMRLKEKDENYEFVQAIKRLSETIMVKIKMLQMTRKPI